MATTLIRQFDVYANPERRTREQIPYVVVLQSDRYAETRGIIIAPLVPADRVPSDPKLYPVVAVAGARLAVVVTEIATVPRTLFREPVATLASDRDRLVTALDLLFFGI